MKETASRRSSAGCLKWAHCGVCVHGPGRPARRVADPDSGSSHWVPIPPAKLSIPLVPPGESQSIAYLVLRKDGQLALALAGRRNNGRVTWSGNGDLIDQASHLLAEVGVLRRQKNPSSGLLLLCYKKSRRQQGHLGRERARWVAIWRRRVAMECGLCRSVLTGSATGLRAVWQAG